MDTTVEIPGSPSDPASAPTGELDAASPQVKTFVIDTSVLLSDPKALIRFGSHDVVLPLVVITELEAKRHHPDLGYFARSALRFLDDLRVEYGGLAEPVPVGDAGGTVRVELNHIDVSALPAGFRLADNDTRILAVAANLKAEGHDVTLVSKDLPMRVKAAAIDIEAQEYRAQQVAHTSWSGVIEVDVDEGEVSRIWNDESIALSDLPAATLAQVSAMPCHTGVIMHSSSGSALARITADKHLELVRGDQQIFGLHGRSAEQRFAIRALLDESIGIVSLGGRAGTGKSALALCAGLEAVLERRQHRKMLVFRPLFAVGGQELGYLPGSESEKMNPWGQAVFDTLGSVVSQHVIDEVIDRGLLEVLPLTHIRGRSFHDCFVIVDEAQSLERNVLLTVLSRVGQNSRIVLTHDVAQRDNLRVGRYDGVAAVIESLKGHPIFAHVTLTRPERSAVAALVTEMLESYEV